MGERFPNLPARMRKLPINERGFPVPYFVAWIDGKPDFRVADTEKHSLCLRQGKCWLCGEPLGVFRAFVIGPMCAINRITSEPPSHRDCAIFAATACPFLTHPLARRRAEGLPEDRVEPAGMHLDRNPGAVAVWVCNSFRRFRAHKGNAGHLIEIDAPTEVLWFAEGRTARRSEVEASIAAGLPKLRALAQSEGNLAMNQLEKQIRTVPRLLPAEERADG